ncbi:MAG: molybdopterin molybdotransferase MoeA [Deltaproteobacteria bacterium]|nr:molybdopterin molybdotransferase MoeA [Deltaproteobacteria bacterium]
MISVNQARQKIIESAVPLAEKLVPAELSLSYHLTQDVLADRPIPPFNRVAMDGFAVKSEDFSEVETKLKIIGATAAGEVSAYKLQSGETVKIMTGAPLTEGADAVVKVEHSEIQGDYVLLRESGIKPGLNIANEGEDAQMGKLLLTKGQRLSPAAIAVCSSVGLASVGVYQKPKVKIICTGSEIIHPSQEPLAHQIRECNSYSLRSLCESLLLEAEFLGIVEDEPELLKEVIKKGLESDILLLTGGVSMGDYDYVPQVLKELGVKQIFHKVNLKPGKPVWFGKSSDNRYVFGLPGNPVSVQVNFKLFVEPLIKKLSGDHNPEPFFLRLPLLETITKKNSREQYFAGKILNKDGRTYASQVAISGSGDFSSLASSQGLIRCPSDTELLQAESYVEFLPWGGIC